MRGVIDGVTDGIVHLENGASFRIETVVFFLPHDDCEGGDHVSQHIRSTATRTVMLQPNMPLTPLSKRFDFDQREFGKEERGDDAGEAVTKMFGRMRAAVEAANRNKTWMSRAWMNVTITRST